MSPSIILAFLLGAVLGYFSHRWDTERRSWRRSASIISTTIYGLQRGLAIGDVELFAFLRRYVATVYDATPGVPGASSEPPGGADAFVAADAAFSETLDADTAVLYWWLIPIITSCIMMFGYPPTRRALDYILSHWSEIRAKQQAIVNANYT